MQTSRERKIKFIRSFGDYALEKAITAAVHRLGAENFLTDEQLDEITAQQVSDARFSNHLLINNRRDMRIAA